MAKPAFDFSKLSAEQRLELICEIWDSLEAEQLPLDPEYLAELERRRAELADDPTEGRPASEVVARVRHRLK